MRIPTVCALIIALLSLGYFGLVVPRETQASHISGAGVTCGSATDGHVYTAQLDGSCAFEAAPGAAGGDSWGDAVDADILPTGADDTYDLGSAAASFADAFIDGTATIAAATITAGTVGGSAIATAASTSTFTNKTLDCNGTGNSCANVDVSADVTGTLPIGNGGTGAAAKQAAMDALSPVTTRGDLVYRDASNNVRLAVGADGEVLGSDGTDPVWEAVGTGLTEEINGQIETVSNKSLAVVRKAKYARQVDSIAYICVSGAASVALWTDSTAITTCSSLAGTTAEAEATCDTGATNDLGAAETLWLELTNNSSCTDFQFTIQTTRD